MIYSKQSLINGINKQFFVLKHLHTKVTHENVTHKFSEPQRDVKELMIYLGYSLEIQIKNFVNGTWDNATFAGMADLTASFDRKSWDVVLDSALVNITAMINGMTDEQCNESITIFWETAPRFEYITNHVLITLGAYKMQLFLQLKASGLSELNTMNLWGWMDGK
jgi:hypothetical protein